MWVVSSVNAFFKLLLLLTAQFGWNELDYSSNSRYLKTNLYTYLSAPSDSVSTFRPCCGNGNTYLDVNPYTFGGTTYLIGLSTEDGNALIIKLASGGALVDGYAYYLVGSW